MKSISLFACGGIGDLGLRHAGFDVLVANELIPERAEVFKYNFPESHMIIGDIWEKQDEILSETKRLLGSDRLDLVFATPPCQGMSKNGRGKLLNLSRAGLRPEVDPRNLLVLPTIAIFKKSEAHTLVMENVPEMENTFIPDPENGNDLINIIDLIGRSLGPEFTHSVNVVEFADYGVPQSRQRLISIFTKNQNLKAHFDIHGTLLPPTTHNKLGINKAKWVTVRDAIYDTPPLDASSAKNAEHKEIPYHRVPLLDEEKYLWVSNTATEKSAFDNQCINPACRYDANPSHKASRNLEGINRSSTETPIYCLKCSSLLPRPWVKKEGQYRLMKGFTSAYKRMSWNSPASTLTRNLSYACSDNKLHPEQNRVLSLYEAMKLHTIADYSFDWRRADGKKVSDKLIRELIGESIPPKGLEQIFAFIASVADNKNNIDRKNTFQKQALTSNHQQELFV
ncbi:DNA cytosine methyltransferase [Pseudomonas sp. Leaf129]|uniref:DNA cytosine methyltransferase n=1 Tax=Pseudomonas sp. Leaf129 TaxID=1736268 RepID=UPI0009E776F7|nr:DNA cytosine methyltransferase [Pseudomonas sp. Leaf129]